MSTLQCLLILTALAVAVTSYPATVINVFSSDQNKTCDDGGKGNKRDYDLVAFSVGRLKEFAPTSNSKILMNHVFYNDGNHFSLSTGIFTAPVSGVYSFYFGGSGKPGKGTHLYLYAGNPEKAVASAYNYNKGAHNHASGSVILKMMKGDMASVWLAVGTALNAQNPPSTHFSGFFIK